MEQQIMAPKYGQKALTEKQLKYLKEHEDLATKRAQKDVDYLLSKSQDLMNESMNEEIGILSTQTVVLGTDDTLYSCDTGNKGYSEWGLAYADTMWSASGEYSRARIITNGVGDGDAWAWVGPKVYISGTQGTGQYAWVQFNGSVEGGILGGFGGSAEGLVRVSIWDYTRGTEVGSYTIWNEDSTNNNPKSVDTSFSPSVRVYLEAGHTYAFRYGVSGAASMYAANRSHADFYSSLGEWRGLDFSSLDIDF